AIVGVFWAIQNKSSRATVFTVPVFRLPSRRWPRTSRRSGATRDRRGDDHHELVRYESSVDGTDSNAAKAFQQSFTDDRLVALMKREDEGKKAARARAIPHHPARRHGARYLKSGVGLTSYARYARAVRRSSRT